jgi:hypothetical protein
MINPAFRLVEAGNPQGLLWGCRAEERWRKQRPSCNRTDRGCCFNPAAQAVLTSSMVGRYEKTCRTFNERKSK